MEIEIQKSENGYHVKNKETDEERCYENAKSLLSWMVDCLPCNVGDEIKITG